MASSATRLRIDVVKSRLSQCDSRKVGYVSQAEAFDAAEIMMQRAMVMPGCHITPYRCDDCGEWHVFNRRIV